MKKYIVGMAVFAVMLLGLGIAGCGKKAPKAQAHPGFSNGQVQVVAASEKKRYEQLFSEGIWNVQTEGNVLYKDVMKGQIQEFCDRIVLISVIAEEQKIALNESEQKACKEAASEFWNKLSEMECAAYGITEEECRALFATYGLADKAAGILSTNMNLEVSENEAKVIRLITAKSADSDKLKRFLSAYEAEEGDFLALAGKMGVAAEERLLGRKEEDDAYEEIAFGLKTGEVSGILRKGDEFEVLYCLDDYDEEATAERKALIFEERQKRSFEKLIDEYSKSALVSYEGTIWNSLDMASLTAPAEADFFASFGEYREKVRQ